MPHVTVTIRTRGIWQLRLACRLLLLARAGGIVRSDDHAVVIAERLAQRVLRFEMRQGRHWRPLTVRGR